jgi:hypothetical protein
MHSLTLTAPITRTLITAVVPAATVNIASEARLVSRTIEPCSRCTLVLRQRRCVVLHGACVYCSELAM